MTLTALRYRTKQATPFAVLALFFATADTETRTFLLNFYAIFTAVAVGWYIIAKHNYLRWLAGAEQRAAESKARTRALLDDWYAPKPEQQTADWFNWDGPYTVAGQPR